MTFGSPYGQGFPHAAAAFRGAEVRENLPVYAEGTTIFFAQGTRFPPYCVKCGEAAHTQVSTTLRWHPSWVYFLILLNGLFYVIAAALTAQKAPVSIPLCATHYGRRRLFLGVAWGLGLLSLMMILAGATIGGEQDEALLWSLVGAGLLGVLVALVVGLLAARLLRATQIDPTSVRATGAGQGFLARLAPSPWFRPY